MTLETLRPTNATLRPPMTPVTSSNLAAIGYDTNTRQLYVRFKSSGLYVYDDVPELEHEYLMCVEEAGESVGRAFNERIKKGGYNYKRIDDL